MSLFSTIKSYLKEVHSNELGQLDFNQLLNNQPQQPAYDPNDPFGLGAYGYNMQPQGPPEPGDWGWMTGMMPGAEEYNMQWIPGQGYVPYERKALSPWELAQQQRWQQEQAAAQMAQQFEQQKWGQQFGLQQQGFDLERALAEAQMESQKRAQKLAEDQFVVDKWAKWQDMLQKEKELAAQLSSKDQWIKAGLISGQGMPVPPQWMQNFGISPDAAMQTYRQGGDWAYNAELRPPGGQAWSSATPDQLSMMQGIYDWQAKPSGFALRGIGAPVARGTSVKRQ